MNSNRHPISQQLSGQTTKLLKFKKKQQIEIPIPKLVVADKKEPVSLDNDKFDLIRSLQDQGDDSDSVSSYSDAASDNGEEVDENVQKFVLNEY